MNRAKLNIAYIISHIYMKIWELCETIHCCFGFPFEDYKFKFSETHLRDKFNLKEL